MRAIRSNNPRLGHPLVLAAGHRSEYTRTNCTLAAPTDISNVVYIVPGDGHVYDGAGNVADGVEVWDDGGDRSVCGVRILSMDSSHSESSDLNSQAWEIRMQFAEGGIFGQEDINKLQVIQLIV